VPALFYRRMPRCLRFPGQQWPALLCACHPEATGIEGADARPTLAPLHPRHQYTPYLHKHAARPRHSPSFRKAQAPDRQTKPPRLILADLHHIARDQADMVSSMTRGAAALFRDSKKPQSPNQILDTAEAVLDDLEDVHLEIERRLQALIDRARRNMRSTPTRKKAARVRKAHTPATVATHDNVIAFKPRRDDSKTRPL